LKNLIQHLSYYECEGKSVAIHSGRNQFLSQFDTSRISRLLDHLSDDENNDKNVNNNNAAPAPHALNEYDHNVDDDVCLFPISGRGPAPEPGTEPDPDPDNIVIDVEDLLQLALDERKGKQEAKQVTML
jgi:hypothetical protein